MNFAGITHVIVNPRGTLSLVGSVPASLCTASEPTVSDIMAGRVQNGKTYRPRVFASIADLRVAVAELTDVNLCNSPGCACRSILGGTQ